MTRKRTTRKPSGLPDERKALILRAVVDLKAKGWEPEEVQALLERRKRTYESWLAEIEARKLRKEREGYRS